MSLTRVPIAAELGPLRASDPVGWNVAQERVRQAASSFRATLADDWEDAVQEAQIKVLRAIREAVVPNQRALMGLIGRITYTTCIDQLRRRKIRQTMPLDSLSEPPAAAEAHPPATLEQREARRHSRLILGQLSGDCRQLLWMLLQGRSYGDLAELLGAAPGAIRVRAHRCRQQARLGYLRLTSPVVEVAFQLFKRKGFLQTRVEQIAAEAGVSPELVAELFADKRSILWAAATSMVSGSNGLTLEESESFQAIQTETDPHRRLHLTVVMTSNRFERGIGDLRRIVYQASTKNPEYRHLIDQMNQNKKAMSRSLVRGILGDRLGVDRNRLDALAARAMDIDSSATYQALREQEGCTHREAVRCIEKRLEQTLFH